MQVAAEERRAASERDRLTAQLGGVQNELTHLLAQVSIQQGRITLAERLLASGTPLAARGLVAEVEQRRREEALLAQRQSLSALMQQVMERQGQHNEARFALDQLPTVMAGKIQLLRSELATAEQRIAEVNGRHAYIVLAPIAGTVSSLQASLGQAADPQRLQLQIVPGDSALQAELFIPARAIGFVKAGQDVRILYDAFPYQHYSAYRGRIVRVSQTVLAGSDVSTPVALREPAYRATVALDRPDIDARGQRIPLQPDMLLRADVILERRTLMDWILNPLLSARRRLPSIMQTEAAECGLACLAMVASFHGHRIDLNTLRRRHPVSLKGVTLRGLIQVASQMHLASRPLRFEIEGLRQLRLPAIVHWDVRHFVVLKAVTGAGVVIHDPAEGIRTYPLAAASKHLTGVALELAPTEGFAPKNEKVRLPFSVFWQQMPGTGSPLVQVFALSVILELLVIAAPFYVQLTVDEVVARGDVDLLSTLALGFGLLMALNVATTAMRSHIVLVLQNNRRSPMRGRSGARSNCGTSASATPKPSASCSGSIADNICFFDPDFDQERMFMCAQVAGVHDEIMAMPMAYNSLIGDMGSSLSRGQKQRVLLARALYKGPKILFLDEGTAHLDVANEMQINERLRRLDITRISVAHRPEMMTGADTVLQIG